MPYAVQLYVDAQTEALIRQVWDRLAEKGVSVALVEKGRLAGEQSSRNWGFCRTQGRDQSEVPLALEALRQWDRMAERVGGDAGFTRAGHTNVYAGAERVR